MKLYSAIHEDDDVRTVGVVIAENLEQARDFCTKEYPDTRGYEWELEEINMEVPDFNLIDRSRMGEM